MEKTIKIDGKDVRLCNNVSWAIIYRDQFGKDIVPSIMPMIASAIDLVADVIESAEKTEDVTLDDVLKAIDGGTLLDASWHLGGLELVDMINVTWALAKCADDDIPEPLTWVRQFDSFPLDVVAPATVRLIVKGMVSSKNLKRLKDLKKRLQPSNSTKSSSQVLSED